MADRDSLDERLLAFERTWQTGTRAVIADFLPANLVESARRELLIELICLDLEFRWRQPPCRGSQEIPACLEDYLRSFPELGSLDQLPLQLATEEYRVRHRWGDRPDHATFLARFGSLRAVIAEQLPRIDAELNGETEVRAADRPAHRPAPIDLHADLSYGDFLLKRMIGAGGSGKVYLAERRSDGHHVAIKFLRKAFLWDGTAMDRFIAEAETIRRLSHPHVITTQGLGTTPHGGCFLAMDFAEGGDLAGVVSRGPVDVSDAVRWVAQACEAIGHAHSRGTIHCDLKPANLLLDSRGEILVTDFGLARSMKRRSTPDSAVAGTAAWMAPEQITRHWGAISPRTDVYGLGAVLQTLLTGKPPWSGHTSADILARVVSATPVTAPHRRNPAVPEALSLVCGRALARSPDDRYATPLELRDALIPFAPDC